LADLGCADGRAAWDVGEAGIGEASGYVQGAKRRSRGRFRPCRVGYRRRAGAAPALSRAGL